MFQERLAEVQGLIEAHLRKVLAGSGDVPVVEAMRYASAGGKRLRAFLVIESARLHGLAEAQSIWAASAVECVHAYSLVHDDLPCMDDDDMRRGQPTVHRKWDEATAVLAGDALNTYAFQAVLEPDSGLNAEVRAELALTLAKAAGAEGMVLGQALDIAAEGAETPLTLEQITTLQAGKTGALITWSACAGARMAVAETGPLATYGDALGLAFQIADDVLDVEGETRVIGKPAGSDQRLRKATYPGLFGIEKSRQRCDELLDNALRQLDTFGGEAAPLRWLARFIVNRGQ